MSHPIRQRIPIAGNAYLVETTDDGSRTLVRRDDDLSFHSGCGAASECDHVYLRNGGFDGPPPFWPRSVLEVGFGTGLAMLRTLDRVISASRPLHYLALENSALPVEVLRHLELGQGLVNTGLADQFLHRWAASADRLPPEPGPKQARSLHWHVDAERRVEVVWTDAREWLATAAGDAFDTVYFDPFDPASNPDLWSETVFGDVIRCLRSGGRLVTYCVKGDVRRRMAAVGFEVQRVAGPADGKREVLIAIKRRSDASLDAGA
ncbi:tRNA (5-methylaminomethyl-2-thiouridine)(34)-methyltransferase MnmD [Allorhodopirellula solitaria]|uniref:tRNA 5-methylaminomethyl-2-thiouridine biosynthesis bifunctional protein MnmC n=1 Tax=Allorhodopirellula solitaria TaxID=2527987 RepID=A0A5C5X0J2_9BACT|nr:tRNA (5-methylaminomethyl-2-thiouridine)(34)-methyltransferase MnmD [Allorhodopirellula solitaria]TWT56119.1 tRNA 5-methylaminomethyl-2-thiouridine biosynthesis bifunctional protein MnmC [Allorhodopirellula solitaria]